MVSKTAAILVVLASLTMAACGQAPSQATSGSAVPVTQPADGLPSPVVDVTSLGCKGDGSTDCESAISAAVQKLDAAGGGTLFFPGGRFLVNGGIDVESGKPIYITGAGRDQSLVVESGASQLLKIRRDSVVIQDLTLDTQTHDGRAAIVVVANHTTLRRARILGGDKAFALYYAGPPGATPYQPLYSVGNQVLDTVIDDHYHDDGFSWSFQESSAISNIDHTGSRLAIYIDKGLVVDGYRYTPGPQAPHGTDGFYITPPSDSVTVRGFVSTGSGGIIGSDHASKFGSAPRISTNITIDGEQVLQSGNRLAVGDAQSLTLENCKFAGSSRVVLKPTFVLQHLRVQNCTLPSTQFSITAGAQVSDIVFANDVFPSFQPDAGQDTHTFAQIGGAGMSFTVQGGTLVNRGGLAATGLSPIVSGLSGYP